MFSNIIKGNWILKKWHEDYLIGTSLLAYSLYKNTCWVKWFMAGVCQALFQKEPLSFGWTGQTNKIYAPPRKKI